jgi:hypothetical protein
MFADDFILAVTDAYLKLTHRNLVRRYRRIMLRQPNIAFPVRYSERMLWRKVVDRNPDFVTFSDKLATKDFIQRVCPDLPVPRTLWAGTAANEIPEALLQQDVFIKANHGCNFNHRSRGLPCDRAVLTKMTDEWLKTSYGHDGAGGQWTYDLVDRKIFVEETIGGDCIDLMEFNVRASNGRALLGSVMGKVKTPEQWYCYLDPQGGPTWGMQDTDGTPPPPLPSELNIAGPYLKAVRFAERLSVGTDYARYDFLWDGQTLYGGEITVFPAAGADDPLHSHVIKTLHDGWDLSQSYFLKTPQPGWKKIYAGALQRKLLSSRSTE